MTLSDLGSLLAKNSNAQVLSLKSLLLNLIEFPGVSMNFNSIVINAMLRLLVSLRRVRTNLRQLRACYAYLNSAFVVPKILS